MSEAMFHAYVECALWTSTDDADDSWGEPLDANYGPEDLAAEALDAMRADVADFAALLEREGLSGVQSAERTGHDFWLTRNHHGGGFWDRGLGEVGERLTALAHPYGESYLYVGDDGLIYVG